MVDASIHAMPTYEQARIDLRRSGTVFDRDGVLIACRFMRTWIARLEGADDPAIDAVMRSIEELGAAATELRTAENRDDYPGLQPTGTWDELQAPFTGASAARAHDAARAGQDLNGSADLAPRAPGRPVAMTTSRPAATRTRED